MYLQIIVTCNILIQSYKMRGGEGADAHVKLTSNVFLREKIFM